MDVFKEAITYTISKTILPTSLLKYEDKFKKFAEEQQDIPNEFAKVINEHFWEII